MAKRGHKEKVKEHLLEKGSLSSWQAITLYHNTRISEYIRALREEGMAIYSIPAIGSSHDVYYTKEEIESSLGKYGYRIKYQDENPYRVYVGDHILRVSKDGKLVTDKAATGSQSCFFTENKPTKMLGNLSGGN